MAPGELVDYEETYVVAGALVGTARVAEAYDNWRREDASVGFLRACLFVRLLASAEET